ncbi:ligase-associated DNA damage response endonuclease PdeM [Polaribacter sp.]|uniref:ligase-associated DNA damage response endonuclease PdeM n=1 Tax=Polaribacter sp. TaxID=1920175 RepID=UPI003F6C6A29
MKPLTIVTQNVACNQEVLTLTNQRVIYWKTQESLILSDLHVGKSAHFQKSGIPIPSSVLQNDLGRLQQLVKYFNVKKLIIVGDLFHAEYNSDLDKFKNWLAEFSNLKLVLIKGNHDRLSNRIYNQFNIEVYQKELVIEGLKFVHDDVKPTNNIFTISGHTHPGVFIKGLGKQRIKLPCFQITENQLILPAFSLFTGLNTKNAPKNCKNYGFTDDAIFEV